MVVMPCARRQVGDVKFGDLKGEDSHGNKYFENKEYPYGEQCGGGRGVMGLSPPHAFFFSSTFCAASLGSGRPGGVSARFVSAWLFLTLIGSGFKFAV